MNLISRLLENFLRILIRSAYESGQLSKNRKETDDNPQSGTEETALAKDNGPSPIRPKHLLAVSLLLALHAACIYGQTTEDGLYSYAPTPQTQAFIRCGSNPVDQYTGSLSVSIPVYTYNDNDFRLPISVGYSSQGMLPGRQTGILGMNWFLNCGGSISREIRGVADDETGSTNGILQGEGSYSEEKALSITLGELNSDGLRHYIINDRETTSDIYHFNFQGHSGTFHFDGNKQLHVYNTGGNHGTYKITRIPVSSGNDKISGFTITTGDGYEYTFGGNSIVELINSTERSLAGKLTGSAVFTFNKTSLADNPVVTWNLTRITAPNGRSVTFEYETVQSNIGSCINTATPNNPFLVTSFSNGLLEKEASGVDHLRNVSIVQTSYLKKISIDNGCQINFSMSLKNCCDRPAAPSILTGIEQDHCITQRLMKLDYINILNNNGKEVHRTEFTYKEKDNRLILTKVHTDGVGDYTMAYHEEQPYPEISTADTDFWGFYNGRGNSYGIISATKVDSDCNDYIDTDAKDPDWHYSRLGCLKMITYPTKGFSTFEYEPNRATNILLKRKHSNSEISPAPDDLPAAPSVGEDNKRAYLVDCFPYSILFYSNDETGGIRLARTTDYDSYGGHQSRTFSYSGGTVYAFPKFFAASTGILPMYNPMMEFPGNSLDKQHIGYSTVREKYSDGSYIVYSYSDYLSHPDEYEGQVQKQILNYDENTSASPAVFSDNILREPNSNHHKRGKVNSIEYYNSDRQLVKRTSYEYAMHDTTYTAYIVMSGNYANSVKRYTGDYRTTAITETEYHAGTEFTTTSEFTYDNMGRNISTAITMPGGICEYHDTEYLNDPSRSIYNLPVLTSIKQSTDGEDATLAKMTRYEYPTSGAIHLPSVIKEANLNGNEAADTAPASLSYTTLQRVAAYDTQGNPTEIVDKHGVHTAILWGYGGLYPVVQARGMTAATLKSLAGISGNSPLQGPLSASQRNALYSHSGSLIEIYEHEPLVGLTKHYGCNGSFTSYEYDVYGRLAGIADSKGRLYSYSYAPATGSSDILLPTGPEFKPIE